MRFREILESEENDQSDRDLANRDFDILLNWIEEHQDHLDKAIRHTDQYGGAFYVDHIGLHNNLVVVMAAKLKGLSGGFGFAGKYPVIVLDVLLAPSSTKYLSTRLSGVRDTFVHEYMHYLASVENKRAKELPVDSHKINVNRYFNHPEEMNAFYQEATNGFARLVRAVIEAGHQDAAKTMWGKSTASLVSIIMNKHMREDFVKALTPENYRRIAKRLARFVTYNIQPMLVDQGLSENDFERWVRS